MNKATPSIGIKHDADKPDYSLLSYPFLEDTIRVLMHGASLYGRNNWQQLPDGVRRCASAIMRHTAAILQGELYDPETGLQHTAHIASEAMFIHHFVRTTEPSTVATDELRSPHAITPPAAPVAGSTPPPPFTADISNDAGREEAP